MDGTKAEIIRSGLTASVEGEIISLSLFCGEHQFLVSSPDICLIIYGGSRDFSQDKLVEMKTLLCKNRFIVASFDFRGMGPDSLNFENTGLHTRVRDARAVLRQLILFYPTSKIYILAVSMGGYIATFLEPREIAGMVLVAPAAYDARAVAEKINFGPDFSKLIRVPKSYLNSDAFTRMKKFSLVRTTIIAFEDDTVVNEIPRLYFDAHPGNSLDRKSLKVFPGEHNGNFSNPERMRWIMEALSRL